MSVGLYTFSAMMKVIQLIVSLNILLLLALLLTVNFHTANSTASSSNCERNPASPFEERLFENHSLDSGATEIALLAVPQIYACRHLCKQHGQCMAISFQETVDVVGQPNCRHYAGYMAREEVIAKEGYSVILISKGNCSNATFVPAQWSTWSDHPPCPLPCNRIAVKQKRVCSHPITRCHGGPAAFRNCIAESKRIRPCAADECIDIASLSTVTSSGVYIVDIASRRIALKVSVFSGVVKLKMQHRTNGLVSFARTWYAYKNGFGTADGEYWLGNDNLHELTNHHAVGLTILLTDSTNEQAVLVYNEFEVADETNSYRLTVGSMSGISTTGDSLSYHSGAQFTTYNKDNDEDADNNCAVDLGGGWWFKGCHFSNLNGNYSTDPPNGEWRGIVWFHWKGNGNRIVGTDMDILWME